VFSESGRVVVAGQIHRHDVMAVVLQLGYHESQYQELDPAPCSRRWVLTV
jgi:hypothetical protein